MTATKALSEAPTDCLGCDRLVSFRRDNQEKYPDYFNGAVPSFGKASARLLIVGLAPGLQGANKTGRPFTGDYAGDLLFATLEKFGFTKGSYGSVASDGMTLKDAMITNAVRCVPPQNKPTGPEITKCRDFLVERINSLKKLRVILCLGRISHDSTLKALDIKRAAAPFGHGAAHETPIKNVTMFDSYHCSRYNTNTKRLTTEMFEQVFEQIRSRLD